MKRSLEEKIIEYIDKDTLSIDQSLELIDNLYWADWEFLNQEYPNHIEKIFNYLKNKDLSNSEISYILRLYNNLDGAYIDEFSKIILDLYKNDKTMFIKSLNLNKEEIVNLVYLFRNHSVKLDEDVELLGIISSDQLSGEEKDTGDLFIRAYKNACST